MRSAGGFSLVEALVATTIMATGLTALAQLYVVAVAANDRARDATRAALFAQQKLEQLLADESPSPSPPGALEGNAAGCFDWLDGKGRPLDATADRPGAAVFIRRWSVEPLPADPVNTLVLHVRVLHVRRGAADIRLGSLKARRLS